MLLIGKCCLLAEPYHQCDNNVQKLHVGVTTNITSPESDKKTSQTVRNSDKLSTILIQKNTNNMFVTACVI